jgi:hypothetical protein
MLSLVSTTLKDKEIIIMWEDSVYISETTNRASIGRNKPRILPEEKLLVVRITYTHIYLFLITRKTNTASSSERSETNYQSVLTNNYIVYL